MQIINCYWGGYFDSPHTLDKTPDNIQYVTLAFSNPTIDSQLSTEFLCSKYSDKEIIIWVKFLQIKGIKILMSIIDSPTIHWNTIDKVKFAKSVNEIAINKWGLDGIDIDAESGMSENYCENFISLVENIRNEIPQDKIITYTCYQGIELNDGIILKSIKDKINWINLMAYFDSFDGMVNLFNDYNKIIDEKNIIIGVKAGADDDYSRTPVDEVAKLCKWNLNKKGMMLWTLNRDCNSFTGKTDWLWLNTIKENLSFNYSLNPINNTCIIS